MITVGIIYLLIGSGLRVVNMIREYNRRSSRISNVMTAVGSLNIAIYAGSFFVVENKADRAYYQTTIGATAVCIGVILILWLLRKEFKYDKV